MLAVLQPLLAAAASAAAAAEPRPGALSDDPPPVDLAVDGRALFTLAVNSAATLACLALADCITRRLRRGADARRQRSALCEVASCRRQAAALRSAALDAVVAAELRVREFERAADRIYAQHLAGAREYGERRAATIAQPVHDSLVTKVEQAVCRAPAPAPAGAAAAGGAWPARGRGGGHPVAPPTPTASSSSLAAARPAAAEGSSERAGSAADRFAALADCPIRSSFTDSLRLREGRRYVVVVDRSHSMSWEDYGASAGIGWADSDTGRTRWRSAELALRVIVGAVAEQDPDGIDLWFFDHDSVLFPGVRSATEVADIFERHRPRGATDLASVLDAVFRRHFESSSGGVTPTSVLVVTDGAPTEAPGGLEGEEAVMQAVRRAANDPRMHSESDLNVTFLQIGDDVGAAEFLRVLDDDLKGHLCKFDIVDVVPAEVMQGGSFEHIIARTIG